MAYWQPNGLTSINTGTSPNDGSGDDIRTSFIKVDNNFSNVSQFLAGTSVDFLNSNIAFNLTASSANVANLTIGNVVGVSTFTSNISMYANIVPAIAGQYDLGSASKPFRNLYVQTTVSSTQIAASSDAGLLLIHANVGAPVDVGIVGNVTDVGSGGANSYAFFGYQYATDNFVYKISPTNATLGNSIVYNGVYGNVQFGSGLLSNTTQSTSTLTGALVVAGGAGVAKDMYVGGTIYSNGYPAVTLGTTGIGAIYNGSGSLFTGNTVFASQTQSISTTTGAVVVIGGVGVGGNVTATNVNGALYGPYYGTAQTAAQPNITSLGTLTSLAVSGAVSAGSVQTTSIGVTNITATGNVNVSTINGLIGLQVTGNTTSTGFVGNFYGTNQTAAQPNITSVGTLTGLNITGNTASTNTLYARGIYDNGIRVVSTSAGAGNLTISGNGINLTPIGPGAITAGSSSAVPVITTDAFGRIVSLTTTGVATTLSLASFGSGVGSGTVALASQTLNIAPSYGIGTTISGQSLTIYNTGVTFLTGGTDTSLSGNTGNVTVNSTSTLASVTGRGATTSTALTLNGQVNMGASIIPTANVSYNLGSSTAWWNNIYGTAIHAQYADLAENYASDADYEPGTVVVFGGDAEITTTTKFADVSVAGAISTNPAYLMNDSFEGLPVALRGRVPVKVIGPVQKGDLLVSAGQNPGYATSVGKSTEYPLAVFAKAIETNTEEGTKVITAVIL